VNGVQVGTISNEYARHTRGFGAIGGYHYDNPYPESASQYWGDINYFAAYNRGLNNTEINTIYQSLKTRYNSLPLDIVQTNLLFRLDPSDTSGYSISGSTWYDLSGNGRNVEFYSTPVINSNNGGVFDMPNNQNLKINNTDFRTGQYTIMYAVRNFGQWECLTSVYDANYNLGYARSQTGNDGYDNIYRANGCVNCNGVLLNSQDSDWRIFTGTVDTLTGTFKLYKNGSLVSFVYGGIELIYSTSNDGGSYAFFNSGAFWFTYGNPYYSYIQANWPNSGYLIVQDLNSLNFTIYQIDDLILDQGPLILPVTLLSGPGFSDYTPIRMYLSAVNNISGIDNGLRGPYGIGINFGINTTASEIGFITAYDRVLTDGEIKQNYAATKTRFGLA
jgi:hypothetical protein